MKNFIYCFLIVTFFDFITLLNENAVNYHRKLADKFELVAFLEKDVSAPEVIKEKILRIENLKSVKFISKELAKDKLQAIKEEITLAGENPFPDSFSIQIEQISSKKIQLITEEINKIHGINELRYDAKLVEIIDMLFAFELFSCWALRIILITVFVTLIVEFIRNRNFLGVIHQKYAVDLIIPLSGTIFAIFVVEILRYYILRKAVMHVSTRGVLLAVLVGIIVGIIEFIEQIYKKEL